VRPAGPSALPARMGLGSVPGLRRNEWKLSALSKRIRPQQIHTPSGPSASPRRWGFSRRLTPCDRTIETSDPSCQISIALDFAFIGRLGLVLGDCDATYIVETCPMDGEAKCFSCNSERIVRDTTPLARGYVLRLYVCPSCKSTLRIVGRSAPRCYRAAQLKRGKSRVTLN